ncbi:zinc ribbon domain-containing protein [Candidatus Dojkabacteria bacterium]|nr:zinc ribbon domain-containing protein [Candidatus Dojkabacteria bacterium]
MANIPFTDNYEDMSNESGYQFKFICEKCGNGYMSTFKKSTTGVLSGALNVVGNIFGGAASSVASSSDDVHRMAAGPQHDKALDEAVKEIYPKFIQCKRCGTWVCKEVCWNNERGLCKECAPELGEEMSSAQAQHSRDEAFAHARMAKEDKHLGEKDWDDVKKAVCPKCNATVKAHSKFCTECGAEIVSDHKCVGCGAKLGTNAKFCPECGLKV